MNTKKIKVKLHPGSSREEMIFLGEDNYEVWIKEKPVSGKANLALEKFLKKELGFKVKVVLGLTSRNKVLEIIYGN